MKTKKHSLVLTDSEIVELVSVKRNSINWEGQPEWDCVVKLEDGRAMEITRIVQWNKPQAHHLQATFQQFPQLFQPTII